MQITLNINEIKIPETYATTVPKRNKLNSHMKHYLEYGTFKHNIMVTQRNTLVDGLCSYIIAMAYGMDVVECEVNTKPLKGKAGKWREIISPHRKRRILFEQQKGKCTLYGTELQIDEGLENGISEDSLTVISKHNAILLKSSNRICFCVDERKNKHTVRYTAIEEAIKYIESTVEIKK